MPRRRSRARRRRAINRPTDFVRIAAPRPPVRVVLTERGVVPGAQRKRRTVRVQKRKRRPVKAAVLTTKRVSRNRTLCDRLLVRGRKRLFPQPGSLGSRLMRRSFFGLIAKACR